MNIIRKLSHIEAHMAYMHEIHQGNTQVSTVISLIANLKKDNIIKIIEKIYWNHPMMRAFIIEKNNSLYFSMKDLFPNENIIFFNNNGEISLSCLLENELQDVLDPNKSLWRIKVIHNELMTEHYILFTRHHSAFDAYSANIILNELIIGLNQVNEDLSATNNVPLKNNTFPPGTEYYFDCLSLENTFVSLDKPMDHLKDILFYSQTASLTSRRTGVIISTINTHLSTKIKDYCKKNNITINSFFSAIFARSMSFALNVKSLNIFTAVSLREKININTFVDDLCCFICVLNANLECSNVTTRELGEIYQNILLQKIDTYLDSQPINDHPEIKSRIKAQINSDKFSGIGMTNLGRINISLPFENNFKVTNYKTAVSRVGGNLAATLHLSMFEENFDLTITYPKPLLSNVVINAAVSFLHSELENI